MNYKSSTSCAKKLVLFLVIINCSNALAQTPGVWQTFGPLGSAKLILSVLISDPTDPRKLFVGTRDRGVYRSTIFGLSWQQANAPMNDKRVNVLLAVDATLYAGTSHGVFRSMDGGVNWIQANAPMNDKYVATMISLNGTLYAGIFGFGLFQSTDGGINWTLAKEPMSNKVVTYLFSADKTLYAGVNGGVFRSTDGVNWMPVNALMSVSHLATIISANGRLYAGTDLGVFWSTDGGVNWTQANAPMNDKDVTTLLFVDGTIYAGTNGHGVFWSINEGMNWTQANNAPLNYTSVYTLLFVDGTIYAGTYDYGVFRSIDGGTNWTQANAPMNDKTVNTLLVVDSILYALTASGIFRSIDGGVNWFESSRDIFFPFCRGLYVDINVIVTYGDGVFQSTDGGVTWRAANPPLSEGIVTSLIAVDGTFYAGPRYYGIMRSKDLGVNWLPANAPMNDKSVNTIISVGKTLYAGVDSIRGQFSYPYGVFRSTDGGVNWTQANAPMNSIPVYTLLAVGDTLYAGTDRGIYWSIDGGVNWTRANSPANSVNTLIAVGKTLYAVASSAVIRSIDGGQNWVIANAPMNDKDVNTLLAVGDTLYAGTSLHGVFRSTDGGMNWIQANPPINDKGVSTLFSVDRTLYAGTYGYGVFRSTDGGINWYPLRAGQSMPTVTELASLPELNRLYAATLNGVYFQTLDAIPPAAVSMTINGAATFCKQRNVQLTLIANAADSMLLSENSNFSNLPWQAYQINPIFTLSSGDGPKTIYSKFADISYNFSNTLQASITLDTTPPTIPNSRESQSVSGQPNKRILSWTKSTDTTSNVDRYRVHLSQTRNFSGATTTRDSVFASENPSYTTPTLADAKWYWRVTAIDRAENESVSPTDSFVVNVGQAPIAPAIQLAVTLTNNNTPTISWSQVEGAVNYRLQYAASSNFANAVTIPDLPAPSYTFMQALSDGLYFFRVYAKNVLDVESVASPTAQLTIDTRPPQNPVLQIATGEAYTKTANVTLRLSAAEADSVRLIGNLTNNDLTRFQLFDLVNQVRTQIPITLSSGDGRKDLQAQFKDRAGNTATAFRSIFLDMQTPAFPTSTPQLSVATPSLNQTVAVSLAAPTDAGSGVKSFALYYRKAGEKWDNQNKAAFQNNLTQIPSAVVTNRGVDYQIVAEDSAGNKQTLRNGDLNFFSIPVSLRAGDAGSSVGLPGGSGGPAYRLISLPLLVSSGTFSEVFANLGTYGADKDYRVWRFNGGAAWEEGERIPVQPGTSYFLIKRESGSVSNKVGGTTANATDAALGNIAGWQLRPNDWTLIGNPFNFEIDLINLRLKNRDTSLVFIPNVWSYDGGSSSKGWTQQNLRLSPWSGVAIYNDGAADVLILTPSSNSPTSLARVAELGENEWRISIGAESKNFYDNENYFGVREKAQISQDEFDRYEPPLMPGGLSLSFAANESENRRSLASDIRPRNEDGYEWTLQLKGVSGSAVKLHFEDLASLPADVEIYLLDRASQIMRDVRRQPELVVRLPLSSSAKILTLIVGNKSFVEDHTAGLRAVPQTFALRQNYPNPFNPTTVIRYELPVSGKVTLRIYDLQGREMLIVEKGIDRAPGFYETIVDLSGFAAGIYFYRISVSGEQNFDATKKMVLVR